MYFDGYTLQDIAVKVKSSRKTIGLYVKEKGYPSRQRRSLIPKENPEYVRKYTFNQDYFQTIDTEEKAYWLGFLYADGCISYSNNNGGTVYLGLKHSDVDHIKKFLTCLDACENFPIHNKTTVLNGKEFDQNYIALHSVKMVKDLINCGCVERKSLILKRPNIDNSLIRHFARGYFDGDGSATVSDKSVKVAYSVVGTFDVLSYIKQNSGISDNIKIRPAHKGAKYYTLDIHGYGNCVIFYNYMYNDSSIWLDRKKTVSDKMIDYIKRNYPDRYNSAFLDDPYLRMNKSGVPVVRISLDGLEIKIYESVASVAKELNKNTANCVFAVCDHKQKTAYGYYWLYYIEYLEHKDDIIEYVDVLKNTKIQYK